MPKTHIKLCGINKKADVIALAKLPIDFMGFIFHPTSSRYISAEQANSCIRYLFDTQIQPVGIFVEHTANEIQKICQDTHIQIVQLHGDKARNAHMHLPNYLTRIFVIELATNGQVISDLSQISLLNPARDYLLFDLKKGEVNRNEHLAKLPMILNSLNTSLPYFIAGGINLNNLHYLKSFYPFGIDMASAIEDKKGNKNPDLAKEIITKINEVAYAN